MAFDIKKIIEDIIKKIKGDKDIVWTIGDTDDLKFTANRSYDDDETFNNVLGIEIDGKAADDSEIANIPPGDIVSMDVVDAKNGQPKKIIITTKKKK